MTHRKQASALLRATLLIGLVAAVGGAAFGQSGPPPPPPPDPNLREVALVRQDESDCHNSTVSNSDPSLIGGTAWVVRGSDGTTKVKVAITGKRYEKYHFFLKCVRILGDLQASEEGVAEGEFSFSNAESGNLFGFDMYPEGAPPGNKYQSMTVRY
ncbi:MAG: hypothetical protein E6G97_21355 [Alphaproteobacteria bacterium]|nr:MAG: hypothetical protein E6G97_21355 [Alphaproteobacteria bacterium]